MENVTGVPNGTVTCGARVCPYCGGPVERGPKARWCSESCRVLMWRVRRRARDVARKAVQVPPAPPVRRIEFVVYDDRPPMRKVALVEPVGTCKPAPNEAPGTPRGGSGVLVSPREGVAAVRS